MNDRSMSSGDISYIICNLWSQIDGDDQVRIIFMFYNHLQYEEQCDVFSFLGDALNQEIYEESVKSERRTEDITLFDLKAASKEEFYQKCEKSHIHNIFSLLPNHELASLKTVWGGRGGEGHCRL